MTVTVRFAPSPTGNVGGALRDKPAALPVLMQFPLYPRTDASREYDSLMHFSEGFGLSIRAGDATPCSRGIKPLERCQV